MLTRGALVAIGAVLLLATPGYAAFPGLNGKLAFERSGTGITNNLRTINPDGSGEAVLPTTNDYAAMPSWSADGQRVAFRCWVNGVCVKTIAGGDIELYEAYGTSTDPSFSPGGAEIVFSEEVRTCPDPSEPDFCWLQHDLATVPADSPSYPSTFLTESPYSEETEPSWSADGSTIAYSGLRYITPDGTDGGAGPATGGAPDWSPDATRLVYSASDGGDSEIYVVSRNGGPVTKLTDNSVSDDRPVWSPDSSMIAFASNEGGDWEIFVMKADGIARHPITSNSVDDVDPSWQPLPPTGYARPKVASPSWTWLVPAYQACTSPDRKHGPPLAYDSCSNPQEVSQRLTVGTADSNGRPTKFTGNVRYDGLRGDPTTPADEADVQFILRLDDVRRASDLEDYEGELDLRTAVRLTDRASGPAINEPATTQDFDFAVPFSCAATTDTTIGSHCALVTTVEALAPGAVREGDRSVWELGQARVYDGGPDGVAATQDNTLFMVQGIFVP
jgi:WD40-like Beta Propeller Repeat